MPTLTCPPSLPDASKTGMPTPRCPRLFPAGHLAAARHASVGVVARSWCISSGVPSPGRMYRRTNFVSTSPASCSSGLRARTGRWAPAMPCGPCTGAVCGAWDYKRHRWIRFGMCWPCAYLLGSTHRFF